MIEQLTIIGVGLIGGSFAKALKKNKLVHHVIGCGRQLDNLKTALKLGIIDEYSTDIKHAVKNADVIFIATPVSTFAGIFSQLKGHTKSSAIITDGGSTKLNVMHMAQQVFGQVPSNFVPGHPIAGTENSGASAAFAELYEDHKVILTPLLSSDKNTIATDPRALEIISNLWAAIGAEVVCMDAEHHDLVLGATSHLPHVIAFSLVNTLATLNERKEIFDYAAGGFKDFTRIASSDPKMWQDICLANKDILLSHLNHFKKDLGDIISALNADDSEYMYQFFSRAKTTRDALIVQTSRDKK
ncbi:MAG: prephenate dehydrogenase/arogenate dehydrogenase family protein [Pseudomonadota bacterium]